MTYEMTCDTHASNPFMLMLNPEVVIAAMEASERLKSLNSHQCRPLDKIVPAPDAAGESGGDEDEATSSRPN
jgi:hypothetical protein